MGKKIERILHFNVGYSGHQCFQKMYCMFSANYDALVVLFLKAVVNTLNRSGPFLTIKYPVHNSVVTNMSFCHSE